MKPSKKQIEELKARSMRANPQRLEDCRKGGKNRAAWYGSASMAEAGRKGGIVRFLAYGREGMRQMILQYWAEVRAGLRPAPASRKGVARGRKAQS